MSQLERAHTDVLVILNPTARHGLAGRLEERLVRAVQVRDGWTLRTTTRAGDATRFAAAGSARTVVAVGGDGTVHEVVNGLMALPPAARPMLGVVPAGSGDDYARMLGLPKELDAALAVVDAGATRSLDIGRCNGAFFMNSLSIGLDARVTAYVGELKSRTGQTGLALYARGLAHILFKDYRTHEIAVSWDGGRPATVNVLLLAAGIGPTYGGGFRILPGALPDDGLLDVITVDALPLADALWRLPFVVTGKHVWMRPVEVRRASSLMVESELPLVAQVDGEVLEATAFDVAVEQRALRVLAPGPA